MARLPRLLGPTLFLVVGVIIAKWHFLAFHLAVEVFSVIISSSVFVVAWASRRFVANGFFLAVGIGYAHVAALDFTHALAYKGMGLLDGGSADPATQLWMAARFVEVVTLLSAFTFIARPAPPHLLRLAHLAGFAAIVAAIFAWRVFPPCYVDGVGLTPFKINGEYVVIAGLAAAALAFWRHRDAFDRRSLALLLAFLAVRAASEAMFTTYVSVYGDANMVGHLLKTMADWLLYLAAVERTLEEPYGTLFKEVAAAGELAQESEKRYRGLVQSQTDLVVRFDSDGRFTFVNDTACRTFGRPADQLLGQPWSDFVHPDDVPLAIHAIRQRGAAADRRVAVELRVVTVAGTRRLQWEGVAICDGDGAFLEFQAAGRDVTERRATEAALKAAKLEAERANEAKSRFLAAASHDLRQPFQAMTLYHDVLKARLSDPADRKVIDALGSAMSAGQELLTALLDLSTLQAGTVQPQIAAVPVGTVLEPLARQFADLARERGLRFRYVPCSATVATDPVLLTRMARNLLVNAQKYTARGGVLLGCRRRADALSIQVWDTGPGIPADKHEDIFEEFTQLDNPERDRSRGLGLGLAVVARTGRLLDHPVGLRSQPGKGSVFFLQVPLAATAGLPTSGRLAPADQ